MPPERPEPWWPLVWLPLPRRDVSEAVLTGHPVVRYIWRGDDGHVRLYGSVSTLPWLVHKDEGDLWLRCVLLNLAYPHE